MLREGRLTKGQQRALDELWPVYGLSLPNPEVLTSEVLAAETGPLNPEQIFRRSAPTCLEIGFGDGGALLQMAKENPDCNYIGAEVHRPGVGRLLLQLEQHRLTNVRVFCEDGIQVLARAIMDQSLRGIYLYFPDPWHKKKHHKRRIVQAANIELIYAKLANGGCFHFATDWQPYADEALQRLEDFGRFENCAGTGRFSPRPDDRPLTKFERRGHKLGHGVWDIVMRKVS